MTIIKPARERRTAHDSRNRTALSRIVSYPPPSTGTNHNLVDKVEHNQGERVIWHMINSPDGSFTYDYSIKWARRRRKRCPERECEKFLEPGQRKCSECQLKTR